MIFIDIELSIHINIQCVVEWLISCQHQTLIQCVCMCVWHDEKIFNNESNKNDEWWKKSFHIFILFFCCWFFFSCIVGGKSKNHRATTTMKQYNPFYFSSQNQKLTHMAIRRYTFTTRTHPNKNFTKKMGEGKARDEKQTTTTIRERTAGMKAHKKMLTFYLGFFFSKSHGKSLWRTYDLKRLTFFAVGIFFFSMPMYIHIYHSLSHIFGVCICLLYVEFTLLRVLFDFCVV